MTMMESRFARPLIDHFLAKDTPMTIGTQKYVIGTKICCNMARGFTYSLDYSKFDSSIPERFIRDAFNILETWFSPQDRKDGAWQLIVNYFIHTPIVLPDGKLYVGKKRGVPSGSFFTQLIDSMVNLFLIHYCLKKLGHSLKPWKVLVLGDDSIFSVDRRLSLSDLAVQLNKLGISLNLEKSGQNTYHFLGARWKHALPRETLPEIIRRAIAPEKPRIKLYRRKTLQERKRLSYLILFSLASSWVEANRLLPKHVCAQTLWLNYGSVYDTETLLALERARFAEGLPLKKRNPWLRILR
jgi:hypothetical protein